MLFVCRYGISKCIRYLQLRTFGLLVPRSTKYVDLVEMILAKDEISSSDASLKIEYDVGGNMAPLRTENDNSLFFYLELKRKDHGLTVYVLGVVHVFNMNVAGSAIILNTAKSPVAPVMESATTRPFQISCNLSSVNSSIYC